MSIQFEKFTQDANLFVKDLAQKIGHPNETGRTGILLRSVLHALRNSITISESFDLIAQLPMYLKGLYVDNWKYDPTPEKVKTLEEFKTMVKNNQVAYGEDSFDWQQPTEELIRKVLEHLSQYITKGEAEHIISQLSTDLKELFRESLMTEN